MSEKTEAAYWDGFLMGMSLPGNPWIAEQFGMDVPETPLKDEWDPHEKGGTYIFEVEEPEDQAFWLGYTAGFVSSAVFVAIIYSNAPTGFYGAVIAGVTQHGTFSGWSWSAKNAWRFGGRLAVRAIPWIAAAIGVGYIFDELLGMADPHVQDLFANNQGERRGDPRA